jgi:sugar lactone lactonase YvrE
MRVTGIWLVIGLTACAEVSVATKPAAHEREARTLHIEQARFFPEGVAVDKAGNFYIGSMELGAIHRVAAGTQQAQPFIEPNQENQLVSALGLLADDATSTLYVCSSDAGNAARSGSAPAAIKAFDLGSGAFRKSFAWPAYSGPHLPDEQTKGVTGFCNDLTLDPQGNLYATDSWYPRILKLPAGGDALEEWVVSETFPQDQWHLNGIDLDPSTSTLYVVENHPGALYAIPILKNGAPGSVTKLTSSRELLAPDGLKVAAPGLLVVAEGGNAGGGVSTLQIRDGQAELRELAKGFDHVATLALFQSSAWVVENQGDHFWSPDQAGREATPPFRVVEVPLNR